MIRPDRYTAKSLEAIQGAQALAARLNHQAVAPEHLLQAMLEDRESVVPAIVARLAAKRGAFQEAQGLDRDASGAPARSDCARQARTSV